MVGVCSSGNLQIGGGFVLIPVAFTLSALFSFCKGWGIWDLLSGSRWLTNVRSCRFKFYFGGIRTVG